MIYRPWSLLSSTVVICGGVATAGLAGIFLFGVKVVIFRFIDFLYRNRSLSQLVLTSNEVILSWDLQDKFQEYLCREGERLRQQDRAMMEANRARTS
ncbi:hypothetical protein B296_00006277 [Ensete ventricosum]|uniref:Uncharacterized protein n=1 Tax=Ensete ventricosum TaxID=4639 RepID=A0A427AAQ9_ENSVE|nr:hypothetical protein B296_00006277 [Ensete ventricosum]